MPPPLAQNTSTTPISEPPATTPDATGKVSSLASFGCHPIINDGTEEEAQGREDKAVMIR
jgi:hypothetical protein